MQVELELTLALGERRERVGPVLLPLLAAIREHGSLAAGAREVGVSYRAAWGLLQRWALVLGAPLVTLQRGRGASLSALGEVLLEAQRRARSELAPALQRLAAELGRELAAAAPRSGSVLRVFASHSLAQDILRELLRELHGIEVDLHNHGSLESLRLFSAGACDAAGFHLVEGRLRAVLAEQYRPWLEARAHLLLTVARRRQGLLLPPGNPRRIHALADLQRAGLRFVNRQAGSGTRLLLDALLAQAGIAPHSVAGYANEEFTHSAVAALVASGDVDAGFGVEAAAHRFGLDFSGFAEETYYFALRRETARSPAHAALASVLGGQTFRRRLGELPGYDPRLAGRVQSVGEALGGGPALDSPPGADHI